MIERRDFLKKAAATAAAFFVGERVVSAIENEQEGLTEAEKRQQNTEFIGILFETAHFIHNSSLQRDIDILNNQIKSQNEIRRFVGLPEIEIPSDPEQQQGFQARSWNKDLPTV